MKKAVIPIILASLLAPSALAYIDPGTGGMIVGSVWPFIIAVFGAAAVLILKLFRPIKNAFGKVFKK